MTQRAAALTYYSLLSLFPALLVGVAVLGVFGQEALVTDAADYLKDAGAPPETVDAVTSALESAQSAARHRSRGARARPRDRAVRRRPARSGRSASALNQVWRVEEGRGFVKHKLHNLGVDARADGARARSPACCVFLGGGLAGDVLGLIGLGDTAVDGLADRALARGAAVGDADLRDRLLRGAERRDPALEVHHPRRGVRRGGRGSSRRPASSSTCRSFSSLLGHVWRVRRCRDPAHLAVAHERRSLLFGAELNAVVDQRRAPHLPRGLRRSGAPAEGAGGGLRRPVLSGGCVGALATYAFCPVETPGVRARATSVAHLRRAKSHVR